MKKKIQLFCMLLVVSLGYASATYAQQIIRGHVADDSGMGLIGASVLEKGGSNGTITDMDGNFTLTLVTPEPVLVISYIGYTPQEITVGGKTTIRVTLREDAHTLNEVVVTALGIKKDKKALGYAVSSVDGGDIAAFSKINPLDGLSGQIPGLNISSSGSGVGGSSKVTIRGVSSLTGTNDPLYVIDGVPMDNTGGVDGLGGSGQYGATDYGNAANNINADDIESISVLKGGAAAALYGSRGQNGVIMITTKKGSKKDETLGIRYNYQLQLSNPLIKPNFQNEYSQGSAGRYRPTEFQSWGAPLDGTEVTNFLGQQQALRGTSNPYNDYFQTGVAHNHSVAISNKTDKMGVYFSFTNTSEKGIVPTNKIDKNSITLRFDTKLANFLTLDAKANYINQTAHNRPNLGGSPDNPVYAMWHLPRSLSMDMLENYQTHSGLPIIWTEQYSMNDKGDILAPDPFTFAKSPLLNNPYWSQNLNTNSDKRKRLLGFVELNMDLATLFELPFTLNLKGRAGLDYYTDERQRQTATNTYFKTNGLATFELRDNDFTEQNYDFLLNGGHRFGKFSFNASFGGNLMRRNIYNMISSSESGTINKEGNYVIQNMNNVITTQGIARSEVQSVYGFLSMDWDNQLFVDVTARNDWTSVLSAANRSIFYPSVSGSWLISETFDLSENIDLLKVRASWASVGSGGNYSSSRYNVYGTSPNQFHGLPYGFIPASRVNPDLKSEHTISTEVGANLIMWRNRLNVDVSYYTTGTKNQIFSAPLAPSSGYARGIINAGYIQNSGVEAQLKGSVLRKKDMDWWIGANITYQWNKVKRLPEEVPVLTLGGASGITINAMNGLPVGTMQGTAFNRDENGYLILDSDNLPTMKQNESGSNDDTQELGQIYPDWLLGFSTGFTYKNFSLQVMIDGKLGHNLYSYSNRRGSELGVLSSTLAGRKEWEAAKEINAATGILPNMGYMVEGVKDGVYGEYGVDPQMYWQRVSNISEMWVYDASYLRLRQISLGYQLGKRDHKLKFIDTIGLNFNMNNVCYLMKKAPNISPESYITTGNATGIEIFALPETMQITFGVNVTF